MKNSNAQLQVKKRKKNSNAQLQVKKRKKKKKR